MSAKRDLIRLKLLQVHPRAQRLWLEPSFTALALMFHMLSSSNLSQVGLSIPPMASSLEFIFGTFELDMFSILCFLLVTILVSKGYCLLVISRRLKCAGLWLSRLIKSGHHLILKLLGSRQKQRSNCLLMLKPVEGYCLLLISRQRKSGGLLMSRPISE